jgi:lauroyl/myristoyl acyltransferase
VKYSPTMWGALFACLLPRERAQIRRALRLLGTNGTRFEETRDVLRTFVSYAHCFAESLAVERPEAAGAKPVVHGEEHLHRVLEDGRGAVIVTAHSGAWDFAARCLSRDYALELMLVMAPETDARARGLQDEIRERAGARIAHVGRHPLDALPVLRHLRRGGVVAAQLDRVGAGQTAIDVSLAGGPFAVPAGPFHLAMLSGAPLLPVFTRRTGYFRYEVAILPPIHVRKRANTGDLVAAATSAVGGMESFLRRDPTQWFHFTQ